MEANNSGHEGNEENNDGHEAEFERFKYAFRVLTRLLCAHFSPLVLILDDLQWADTASLQTIDFLLSDTENTKGLVIIGLYRSNEVNDSHQLSQTLNVLESKGATLGVNITSMDIQSLDGNDINRIIMAMLGIDDDGLTTGLAEICHRRTLGNPFFCLLWYHRFASRFSLPLASPGQYKRFECLCCCHHSRYLPISRTKRWHSNGFNIGILTPDLKGC